MGVSKYYPLSSRLMVVFSPRVLAFGFGFGVLWRLTLCTIMVCFDFIFALLVLQYLSTTTAFFLPVSTTTKISLISHPPQVTPSIDLRVPQLSKRQAQKNTCTGWLILNQLSDKGKIYALPISAFQCRRLPLTLQIRSSLYGV